MGGWLPGDYALRFRPGQSRAQRDASDGGDRGGFGAGVSDLPYGQSSRRGPTTSGDGDDEAVAGSDPLGGERSRNAPRAPPPSAGGPLARQNRPRNHGPRARVIRPGS